MYEDDILVEQALGGDDGAVEQLYFKYVDSVFRYAYVHLGDYHDAEELTQTVFWKSMQGLHKFKRQSSFKTWLFSIAYRAIIDQSRKQKRQRFLKKRLEDLELRMPQRASVDRQVTAKESYDETISLLQQLPEQYRMVLFLRFVEENSLESTAEVMKRSYKSVQALQYRAQKKLMDLARKEAEQDEG
ncbi:RNA polymerase sigma factor [Geomicrobium sp. JSM 1781026]|uniref:RNA polymerase sigma factor n=1 Tax=Geomicrobium sp. JSM 1781026 TaxID=3344580 RepID=UPI0035BFD169